MALANDTYATLGAGGLVPLKSHEIEMVSEDLRISVHRITIHYVFRNTTERDVKALVAFPLPDLNGETLYYAPIRIPAENRANFLNFTVTSDGQPVAVQQESRAFLDKREVTARLRAAGVSPTVFLAPLNAALSKISSAERQKLLSENLIEADDSGGHGWVARWALRVKFYWNQEFPAGKNVVLDQTYQPIVGGSYLTTNDGGQWSVTPYCGGAPALREIARIMQGFPGSKDADIILFERTIDYILTTGNNWSGPIRNFHLTVETDSPDDIVLTCMQGLKRTAATRYELQRSDFHPREELKLKILQPNRPKKH